MPASSLRPSRSPTPTPGTARLGEAGFRTRPLAPFKRPVGTETGTATAAFTVARVEPGEMAEGRIQMLTHHTEDAVWQKRWLAHPNGARGLASLVIAVADVDEAAARFARFTGRPATRTRSGQAVQLDRGRIDLVTREAFAAALPEIAIPALPFIGAYGVTVRSLEAAEAILRSGGLRIAPRGRCAGCAVPGRIGAGAWLFADERASLAVCDSRHFRASVVARLRGDEPIRHRPQMPREITSTKSRAAAPSPPAALRRCQRPASAPLRRSSARARRRRS